ncbi:DISARM system phospholipase D-like protein DrmC [Frankia sp. Ag45/Mut15]|uniref:DISARM system phospholipase D-like protein DrmC n=1 Tax=Frankia umida TaxID=573489 RepID=A0ABT0JZN9_9ACTN|nr:DISARM system phospholipase D-like protein DrmC [Frankia umida]MCK9876759.1 DISARM system phospholipase D-like protein DrmC [Frankia umida]
MPSDPADPHRALGEFLTAHEAERLAVALEAGESTAGALREITRIRRPEAGRLLRAAGLGHADVSSSVAILHAIAGARSIRTTITPVWTMPGPQTTHGRLTSEVLRLIDGARISVTCASYNFTPRSRMWDALRAASLRPETTVTVYVDAVAGTPQQVADHLPAATVFATTTLPGTPRPLVSHAKMIVIDHAVVLTTSANFSYRAETTNIELGLLVHDTTLAATVESTLRAQHGTLFGHVTPAIAARQRR